MAGKTTRTEKFPSGIVSTGLGEVERQIPLDEPPALAPNAELKVIGKSSPRHNGRAKVTGAIHYTVDVKLPGMLHAAILRSPLPHAVVRAIDTSAAARYPGVRAVLLAANPKNAASAALRYVGAPVAAVAANSKIAAEEALRLIRVDYDPLPFVADMDKAREPNAPAVLDRASAAGNLSAPETRKRGDAARGFAESEVVVDSEYRTQVQTHCCMEPHAAVADWRADGLTVYISTQYTAGVRRELSQAFGLPLNKVRVIVDGMGGGFGSKTGLGNYAQIAVALSRQAKAPVSIVLNRDEEQMDTGNRPGTWQRLRIGAKRDGRLTAISLKSYGTGGVGTDAGVGNNAEWLYTCPNFDSSHQDVFINAGPSCAFRAPGNVQGAYGLEQAIDELAEKLAIDPLELRGRIDTNPARREERRLGAERIGWHRRHPPGADPGPVKRGLGVAQAIWPVNRNMNSSCEVRVMRDGSVEILSSVQDIGTGITTVLAQVVAEVFGLRAENVTVRIGDTEFPAGPPSWGSLTTASITPPARTAAWHALRLLLRDAAPALHAAEDDLIARDGHIVVRNDPSRGITFREAAALLRTDRISAVASLRDEYDANARKDLGGVQFAEVAVDTETGIIRVERVVAVQDCGRPMNPCQLESQIQGGVLMGLSFALFEDRILDQRTGRMVNANLEAYKLVGACDIPAIEVVLLEDYQGRSATDALGIGEPANIATAPAIANAVYNAIGVRLRALPMTPPAVLAALGKIPRKASSEDFTL